MGFPKNNFQEDSNYENITTGNRILALALVLLLVLPICAACGEKVEKYSYKDVSVQMQAGGMDISASLKPTYEAIYKNSSVEVGKGKVVIIMSEDAKDEMTYTEKDGKLILGGEYLDTLRSNFEASFGGSKIDKYEMYGVKDGDNFNIVISISVSAGDTSVSMTVTIIYAK